MMLLRIMNKNLLLPMIGMLIFMATGVATSAQARTIRLPPSARITVCRSTSVPYQLVCMVRLPKAKVGRLVNAYNPERYLLGEGRIVTIRNGVSYAVFEGVGEDLGWGDIVELVNPNAGPVPSLASLKANRRSSR